MNTLRPALRACLIGIVALQTLLLPQGNCCCAAQGVIDLITGGTSVPECCCLVRTSHGSDADPVGSLANSESPSRKCLCGAAKTAAQKPAPSETEQEAARREFHLRWTDFWLFDAVPFPGDRFCAFCLRSRKPPTLSPSGAEFRIGLHSWLC